MDPELLEYLKSMEGRLNAYTDQATERAKDEMIAASRDMQTETLRYIANVAEQFSTRMRHLEPNAGNLETSERLRLTAIEDRLLRIEKKVLGQAP